MVKTQYSLVIEKKLMDKVDEEAEQENRSRSFMVGKIIKERYGDKNVLDVNNRI